MICRFCDLVVIFGRAVLCLGCVRGRLWLKLQDLLRKHDLVPELRREALVCNQQLLTLLHQLRHLLPQIGAQLVLQTGELHPQRLLARADGWVLELSIHCQ